MANALGSTEDARDSGHSYPAMALVCRALVSINTMIVIPMLIETVTLGFTYSGLLVGDPANAITFAGQPCPLRMTPPRPTLKRRNPDCASAMQTVTTIPWSAPRPDVVVYRVLQVQ